jgi:hypothetical protein
MSRTWTVIRGLLVWPVVVILCVILMPLLLILVLADRPLRDALRWC